MGSQFYVYALRARTLSTVDMAYICLQAKHPLAWHIMIAYNVTGEKGSCDDGEYFGDLTIKKVLDDSGLTDVALFVVRIAGDQQIGGQRFEVIRTLAEELVVLLESQTDKTLWDQMNNPFATPWDENAENEVDMSLPTEQW